MKIYGLNTNDYDQSSNLGLGNQRINYGGYQRPKANDVINQSLSSKSQMVRMPKL